MSHQHNEHNVAPSTLHHLYVQPASRCQVLPWLFNANNISFPILRPGLPNKLIADRLDISVRTVEVHRSRVFEKMEVKSAVELANLLRNMAP